MILSPYANLEDNVLKNHSVLMTRIYERDAPFSKA